MSRIDLARIYANCVEDADCLLWTAKVYPRTGIPAASEWLDGKDHYVAVRRRAYEEYHGVAVPAHMQVATCRNPRCLAKEHFHLITISQKVRKMHADMDEATKRRRSKSLAASAQRLRGKISPEQVAEVRNSEDGPYVTARRLGISGVVASRIKRGESYKEYVASPFAGLGA